jgi:hypothetical protein
MKRTVHQAEKAALSRMCAAIERVIRLESLEAKGRANQWARAWQDKYLSLSRLVQVETGDVNRK